MTARMSSLSNSAALLKAMLPRVPLIVKTILQHGVGLSPVSGKQDLRTELTVVIIRSFMHFGVPIRKQQQKSMRDPGVRGPMWVANVTLPQPEDAVCDAVISAIEGLKVDGTETYDLPGASAVEAEWTGYRGGVGKTASLPKISEEERYRELRKEATSDSVVLYFHGGAYFMMDPCTHRVPVSRMSKETGAPVLSVRYRLAPEHPFPAALVDALTAYLSLIYPPAGSWHDPVPANKIVLAGDSAGGNLALVLLQTLLTLRRIAPSVVFHGKEVPIDLPGGLATSSPWCDISRSMPSINGNIHLDYLPPAEKPEGAFKPIPVPDDDMWPSNPPRVDLYCNASATCHPLVSPLAAPKDLWKDAPPVFISLGEEGLTDEGLIVARRMREAGAPVVVEQYEGLPHCYGLLATTTPVGRRFMRGTTDFMRAAMAGNVVESYPSATVSPSKAPGTLLYIGFKVQYEKEVPLDEALNVSDEEAHALMRKTTDWRIGGEKALQEQYNERAKL